ncbi:hippurate hydrolase [Antricoccus suffuscus]|uniref:Hippurate hydrolase n=1 Tax=Antricoccus suffuscus TaxID=1629062 RepID=A0A2T1A0U5_9ACTN|nr:amidohydrolase [Antricoccus suffuscus]PRZ42226.1 hippurate hydrolase [Antricoccus suffuscus]
MNTELADVPGIAAGLTELYKDLHSHPELSFAEHRTAGIVATRLTALGYEVQTGIGGTGVVGVLRRGEGRTVLLRADMDGLPVLEATGLDYASTARSTDRDGRDVPVMHACGHDMHVACLLGAADALVRRADAWSGTLVVLFQPAEEQGAGALAMVADGLYDRVPKPDVVLGQHVAPVAAGLVGVHAGAAFAAADSFDVRLFGQGGHGSRPETTTDPIVMAAATVMRLQTVVAREITPSQMAVLTVGQIHSGTANNIISDEAMLGLSLRSADESVRTRLKDAVHRVVRAEAQASGTDREPEITLKESFPVLRNDAAATARVNVAFRQTFGDSMVVDPGTVSGSEDVGQLATAVEAPIVFWLFGGTDPDKYRAAVAAGTIERDIPSNHSAYFAPQIRPTLDTGIAALIVAALEWLGLK